MKKIIYGSQGTIGKDLCRLALKLDFTFRDSCKIEYPGLIFDTGRLKFFDPKLARPIFFDLDEQFMKFKTQKISQNDHFARALGFQKYGPQNLTLWDTSFGTGRDSIYIMSFAPKKLLCFERNPWIALLAKDALLNIENIELQKLIHRHLVFSPTDPRDIEEKEWPDIIYYDPMFPEDKNKRLARKEMEFFKKVVGKDEDQEDFLRWAQGKALKRVVVKRPPKAKPIHPHFTGQIKSKAVRYDLYAPMSDKD